MLIKNHNYAKAAPHHHQSSFGSLPFQLAVRSCSSFAFVGFRQARRQAAHSFPVSWFPCLRSWLTWVVSALFSIRSPSAFSIALLGALLKKKSPAGWAGPLLTEERTDFIDRLLSPEPGHCKHHFSKGTESRLLPDKIQFQEPETKDLCC